MEVFSSDLRVCNPLGVAVNSSGKPRLILDLRYVNQHLRSCKFKYEDVRTAADLFHKGDWFFKFDYTSGYHHLEVFPDHTPFLGCSWWVDGHCKFYKFTVLPFGLSTGPYVFTKVQRTLTKHWRSQGICIFTYLDDGAGAGSSFQEAQEVSDLVRQDVRLSGFVANDVKSQWTPAQVGELLGLSLIYQQVLFKFLRGEWTLSVCYWRISCQRDSWPLHVSCLALQDFWLPWVWLLDQLFDFGRVVCTVTSLIQRLGTVHYICQRMLCAKSSSGAIILTTVVTRFGRQALNLRCYHFLMLASPAGGGVTAQVGGKVAVGSWSLEEMGRSSTFRELRATRRVLESFAPHLKGSEVLHRTDNKNTEIILSVGSRKADLHAEAVSIYKLCRVYDIRLTVEWVSRDYNEVADELSRIEDANDYMLDRSCFRSLDKLWGPHLVDRFASQKTKQLDRFCSRFLNPGCEAADAFTVSWAGVNN